MVVNVGETKQIKDMAITSLQVKPFDNKLPVKQCLIYAPLQDCRGLSKDVPLKYLFWVIFAHFNLSFKRKRNKEM